MNVKHNRRTTPGVYGNLLENERAARDCTCSFKGTLTVWLCAYKPMYFEQNYFLVLHTQREFQPAHVLCFVLVPEAVVDKPYSGARK